MSQKKVELVKCPKCKTGYYVKEGIAKSKCSYCDNWVVLRKKVSK